MSLIVLDASLTCSWLLHDEQDARVDAVLLEVGNNGAFVPNIWWVEIRNTLIVSERRGRVTPTQTESSLSSLADLDIHIDNQPDDTSLLMLARRHGLTVYDALYLELAVRLDIPLASLDRALIRAAEAEQVNLAD